MDSEVEAVGGRGGNSLLRLEQPHPSTTCSTCPTTICRGIGDHLVPGFPD